MAFAINHMLMVTSQQFLKFSGKKIIFASGHFFATNRKKKSITKIIPGMSKV
jgi:hypothetical protein